MNGRNRDVLAHIALALARYEKETMREGIVVPQELSWLRTFVMDCAAPRQNATPLGDPAGVVDAEVMTNHPVLTKREAAASLRIHVRTLERLIASGALPVVDVGKSPRVRRIDLDAYIERLDRRTFRDDIDSKETA